jgi:hypothetical protein
MNGPYPPFRAVEILFRGSGFCCPVRDRVGPGLADFRLALRASHRVVLEVDPATPALSVSK